MGWEERITVNPAVRSGKPCIKGTRIAVYDVLEYLAGGMTEDQILTDFPDLKRDDIRASLAFAAARERRLSNSVAVKIIFDANLSPSPVSRLAADYPGSSHLRDVGLREASDADIWDYAKAHGFAIVSKDTDFRERSFVEGSPPKIIWLDVELRA